MTAKYGKDKILMFRLLKEATQKEATKLGLQIEHKLTYERKNDSTKTKDGAISTIGGLEVTLEMEAVTSDDDVNKMLKDSVVNGDTLEIWEIDRATKSGNTYDALYMRGKLDKWEVPSNVEDLETLSTSANIDGKPVAGKVTLTEEQEAEIQYAFRDLSKVLEA